MKFPFVFTALAVLVAAPAAAGQNHWAFEGVSHQGRHLLAEAMAQTTDTEHGAAIRAARTRMLEILMAPTLDLAALARAQAEERKLVMQEHARAQARMRVAYQHLSDADRRAFAENMREREQKVAERMGRARERMLAAQERIAKQRAEMQARMQARMAAMQARQERALREANEALERDRQRRARLVSQDR